MKHISYILVLLFIVTCSSQEKDCSDFKIGTFKYADKLYTGLKVTRIK